MFLVSVKNGNPKKKRVYYSRDGWREVSSIPTYFLPTQRLTVLYRLEICRHSSASQAGQSALDFWDRRNSIHVTSVTEYGFLGN